MQNRWNERAIKIFILKAKARRINARFIDKWPWTAYLVSAVDPDCDLNSPVLELRPDEVVVPLGGVGLEQYGVTLLGLESDREVVHVSLQIPAVVVDHVLPPLKGGSHGPWTKIEKKSLNKIK